MLDPSFRVETSILTFMLFMLICYYTSLKYTVFKILKRIYFTMEFERHSIHISVPYLLILIWIKTIIYRAYQNENLKLFLLVCWEWLTMLRRPMYQSIWGLFILFRKIATMNFLMAHILILHALQGIEIFKLFSCQQYGTFSQMP